MLAGSRVRVEHDERKQRESDDCDLNHDPPPRFGSRQSRLGSPLRSGVEPPKWGQFISLRDRSAAKLDTP